MFNQCFEIDNKKISNDEPCFIIAEVGVNHNGDMENAHKLIDIAADCGADAVKFQTFKASVLASPSANKATYQEDQTNTIESQLDMLTKLELPYSEHSKLMEHSKQRGIIFLSTPFEEESADFLFNLGIKAFKLPSGELTNYNFIKYVSAKGLPIILSTGMSNIDEVIQAVEKIKQTCNQNLALLHCTSAYPADPKTANLKVISNLHNIFKVPVGYSDHTEGATISIAAVALGAKVIEKHFTLDRTMPGPDHNASADPISFKKFVEQIRIVEASLGSGEKNPTIDELSMRNVIRKSIVAACDIPAGSALTADMLVIQRPGNGIPPTNLHSIINSTAKVDIQAGKPIEWSMISKGD
ncbi:MAG: N-acetylneuraminate synthase [Methylocystaceae bacterium]|nr:N-acetylneuraminate synthase [Methylocystaceae bacterium]